MMHGDVLIVGAGPTGLVLALWLTKLGAKVGIIDETAEPGTTSRVLAVHACAAPARPAKTPALTSGEDGAAA
jgi:2-polyprenyl-6-methoxyphenol hydroxylase-like FAD-dependent oxidoreductase